MRKNIQNFNNSVYQSSVYDCTKLGEGQVIIITGNQYHIYKGSTSFMAVMQSDSQMVASPFCNGKEI